MNGLSELFGRLKMRSSCGGEGQAAILRRPSQSVRNPTTWFELGATRDAIEPGFGLALFWQRPPGSAPSERGLVS